MVLLVKKEKLDSVSLPELQETYEYMGTYIVERKERDKSSAAEQIADMARKLGYTLKDFIPAEQPRNMGKVRAKVPPKYFNPDNVEQTWSGRGRQPLWMVSLLNEGRKIEDLLIDHE